MNIYTYIWNDQHSTELFLDGIIQSPTDTHVYNGALEYEPGVRHYSTPEIYHKKYLKVCDMIKADPELIHRVIYITGSMDSDHDHLPGQTLSWWSCPWHYYVNLYARYDADITTHLEADPQSLFCCLNHRPKPHRLRAIKALIDSGLCESGCVTFCNSQSAWHQFIDDFSDDLSQSILRSIRQFSQCEFDNSDALTLNQAVIPDYENYLFDIVTECTHDQIFFTEKTLRPIFWGKPFVVLAHPEQNATLKNMGYETFHEYFDLTSESDYARVIEPLTNLTQHNLTDIKSDVMPKIKHNHSVLVKQIMSNDLIPDLMSDPEIHTLDPPVTDVSTQTITITRDWLTNNSYFSQYV